MCFISSFCSIIVIWCLIIECNEIKSTLFLKTLKVLNFEKTQYFFNFITVSICECGFIFLYSFFNFLLGQKGYNYLLVEAIYRCMLNLVVMNHDDVVVDDSVVNV